MEENNVTSQHPASSESRDSECTTMNSLQSYNLVATDSIKTNSQFLYDKRSGTTGIGGQLYETKLLSLLLLRSLNYTQRFYLGTNINGIGAFDDIVLRYEEYGKRPKVLFIQAKHKEEPDQNKITIQDLFKEQGDFCLHKYFDSYLKIRSKFNSNIDDNIFKSAFKDVDCDFIIYTSAAENFGDRELLIKNDDAIKDRLLQTNNMGKKYQLVYSHFEEDRLLETVMEVRIKLLVRTFMKFLFKDNYQNLLVDEIMKIYHVYLAQNVVEIIIDVELNCQFIKGKFQSTFLTSKERNMIILREEIYKQFALKYGKCSSAQIEKLVKDFVFKLPLNFGNISFNIGGSNEKCEKRLKYICSKIKHLIDFADSEGSFVVKINDDMIGPTMMLQQKDFELYRLGGLVGILFVLDKETLTLKFNESIHSLPPHVKRIFEMLKNEYPDAKDFFKYKFDINVNTFPKLFFGRTMHEVWLVQEFLSNLTFYTNQACENDIENVLKVEISKYCNLHLYKDNLQCQLKRESIFLKVHDAIQKWWMTPNKALYLDENCRYYEEAKEQLLKYSLLNTLHSLCTTKIFIYDLEFHLLDQFVDLNKYDQGFLNIVTNNITLTSIKFLQYLNHSSNHYSYIFLSLDFIVAEKCFEEILTELRILKVELILFTCENCIYYEKLQNFMELLHGFVVVITKNEIQDTYVPNLIPLKCSPLYDQNTAFIDLTIESQSKILNTAHVLFQGHVVPLKFLIKNKKEIIDSTSLLAILNNEIIRIGRKFTSKKITKFEEDCFVERTLSRVITLQTRVCDNIYIIDDTNTLDIQTITESQRDVIIISDKIDNFIKYSDEYADKNIHWFVRESGNCLWKKSRGSLSTLSKYVDKSADRSAGDKVNTFLDIDEKVVILCAGPGMGKSTLMTYLSVKTKLKHPNYWILRINCLDYKNLFSNWQLQNTVIDINVVIKFLYVVSLQSINNVDDVKVKIGPHGEVLLDNSEKENFVGLAYLETEIFNLLYNNGQIVVVMDGVDEISPDYLEQVFKLLEILKQSKVCRLWIATRPYNIIDHLEQKMGSFAFTLQKLSSIDQQVLFVKLWAKVVGEKSSDRLELYVEKFLEPIYLILHDREKKFTSIPLHIYMIAEIYKDFFKDYYNPYIPRLSDEYMKKIQGINSITLYEEFVNIKFYKIRFGDKKPYIHDRDPDMKKMIEMQRREFIKNHKILAAHVIFRKCVSGLFSEQDMKDINDALEYVKTGEERTGIIERVIDDEPAFVHLTFAEYFATEYLCDKLKNDCSKDVWIYLFDTIFVSDKGDSVRNFFDLKLSVDKDLFKLTKNLKYNQEIFETLRVKPQGTALSISVMEFSEKNVLFLLQCIEDVLNKNNLGEFIIYITRRNATCCTICGIVDRRLKNALETVLKLVITIDKSRLLELFKCGDVPLFNALGIAISYCGRYVEDREVLDVILTLIDDTDMALELFTQPSNMGLLKNTIVHVLVMNYYNIRILLKYLTKFSKEQRKKIFTTFDSDGKLAAHFAAKQGDLNFFIVLQNILDRDEFTNICLTYDNEGITPVDYLICTIRDIKKFELVKPIDDLCKNSVYFKKMPLGN